MPLSDREQKMLEQLEQALVTEDPKFVSQMRGSHPLGAGRGRWIVGALGVVVGLALVLLGISTSMWVGALGFVIMVAAAAHALRPGGATPPASADAADQAPSPDQPPVGDRERWDHHQDD